MHTHITRLALDGWPSINLHRAEAHLFQTLAHISPTKFLTLPGGFLLADFPLPWAGNCGWNSSRQDCRQLELHALEAVYQILTPRVLEAAQNKVQYLTVGVDLRSLQTFLHAELVVVVDLQQVVSVGVTGKSYPTVDQEKSLIHVVDAESHCLTLGEDRVLVLGCHDLNIYNGRARANQKVGGFRHRRCQSLLQTFDEFNPTYILHHPHATDTWRSWNQAWVTVQHRFPQAQWASAITYAGRSLARRAVLQDVLHRTHHQRDQAQDYVRIGNKNPHPLQEGYIPGNIKL